MNTSELITNKLNSLAQDIKFDEYMMHVILLDGRELSIPLEWFPRLRDANNKQRKNWRLIGKGIGIHWEDIDEDISIESLLKYN